MTSTTLWRSTGPFIAAALALTGVWLATLQKERSDKRGEWWRRATWAMERVSAGDDIGAQLGAAVLDAFLLSTLATTTERGLIEAIALARMPRSEDDEDSDEV